VAIDPKQLKPADLARLLNSTPLGTVIDERQIYRHRMRAGFRIGDGRRVDLFRYVAWLMEEREKPKPEKTRDYEAVKEAAAARNRALSEAGRDIGELPAVVDPERKKRAAGDFRFFCEAYFPQTFHLPWSPDHLKVNRSFRLFDLAGPLQLPNSLHHSLQILFLNRVTSTLGLLQGLLELPKGLFATAIHAAERTGHETNMVVRSGLRQLLDYLLGGKHFLLQHLDHLIQIADHDIIIRLPACSRTGLFEPLQGQSVVPVY